MRFDAATSRMLAGRALAEAGEHDGAAAELERAAAAFDSFGSIRYRDEAERELRKLGRSTPRRSKPGKANGTGVATLSERELQVGRLVVDRKTNPEIAAELFLSLKTVESHLRNIFRKLDVRSRVEVARAIERRPRRRRLGVTVPARSPRQNDLRPSATVCRRRCARRWTSSGARALESSRPATPNAAGSSAISTTAHSSASSRSPSRSA